MSGLELTLAALRRTQFAAGIAAVLVGLAAVSGTRDYSPARDEAQLVSELLESGVLADICGEAAERSANQIWSHMVGQAFPDRDWRRSEDLVLEFSAHCPRPGSTRPLAEIGSFLAEGLWVDVPSPSDSAAVDFLVQTTGLGVMEELSITWDADVTSYWREHVAMSPITNQLLSDINAGRDSLSLVALFSGAPQLDPTSGAAAFDSLSATAVAVSPSDTRVSLRLAGTVSQVLLLPADILAADGRWQPLFGRPVDPAIDDQLSVFPGLQEVWEDVDNLSPREAMIYLDGLTIEESGHFKLFGVSMNSEILGWFGPVIPTLLLVLLSLHLNHLKRLSAAERDAIRRLPWVGLYDDVIARLTTVVSLMLPGIAAALVAYRFMPTDGLLAIWAFAVAIAGLAIGVHMVRSLVEIREAFWS